MTNTPTDAPRPQEAAEANISRPTWLPDGCPTWCDWPDMHLEHDHYDDRLHTGAERAVVLTASDDGTVDLDDTPDQARMYLRQHYREIEARIEICRDDAPTGIQFTLNEAAEFADKLLELVAVARAETANTEEGPVAERSSGPLTATAWTSPGRVDVFRDQRRPDWERPLTSDEAEKFGAALAELAALVRTK